MVVNDNLNYPLLESTSCRQNHFQCKNKMCIRKYGVCDLKDDCGDNSDESFCCKFDWLSFVYKMSILKKFSTASGALNLKLIDFNYVQKFLWFHSPVDYIEHIEQE